MKWGNEFEIETIDVKQKEWKNIDFSKYDVLFHVAGIAHVKNGYKDEDLYYKINRDLSIDIAKKAKAEGVRQFIFMSSIKVYGDKVLIDNNESIINKNTEPLPNNSYGKSKLQAEQGILILQDYNFNVVIIRAPMIFGKGSKGNYPKLSKIAKLTPVFPDIYNQRSMLHIDNLCEFIRLIILNNEKGIFFPQNKEYVCTSELVKIIAAISGKKIIFIRLFNPLIKLLRKKVNFINKIFGNFVYEKSMSEYKVEYRIRNLKESIELTEK